MNTPYTEGWPKSVKDGWWDEDELKLEVVPLSDAERMREAIQTALVDLHDADGNPRGIPPTGAIIDGLEAALNPEQGK